MALGFALQPSALEAFETYYDILEKRGKTMNLTAIKGVEDVARLHFLDCISLINAYDFHGARVIDVGSGAGFPGVPLKLSEPSIALTLLDATRKKVGFLTDLCDALDIEAQCVHARAEEAARKPEHRECFDVAVSRAVARLDILCELCLPFVCVGGAFLAMKGADSGDEIIDAQTSLKLLGAELERIFDYEIPGTEIKHRAVILRKTSKTPEPYPRRFATIKKSNSQGSSISLYSGTKQQYHTS